MVQFRLRAFDVARLSRRTNFCVVIGDENPNGTTSLVRDVILPAINPEETIVAAETNVGVYGDDATPIQRPGDELYRVPQDQIRRQRAGENHEVAVVLNDVSSAAWYSDLNARRLVMNGRIVRASMILVANQPIEMPLIFRSQIDFVFIEKRDEVLGRVLKEYFRCDFTEAASLRSAMESLQDGDYLVLDVEEVCMEDGVFFMRRGEAVGSSLRPKTPEQRRPPAS